MRPLRAKLAAPVLCLAVVAAMGAESHLRVSPEDADAYHERARLAVGDLGHYLGGWVGRDEPIPEAAVALLRPNAIVSRTYADVADLSRRTGLLVVQCRDSRDMLGHFPPVCYPAHGMTQVAAEERQWRVGGMTITGMEYRFVREDVPDRSRDLVVINFMIVPGVGFVRDMDGVQRAAADHRRRHFGAAQVQLTMPASRPSARRDADVAALLGDCLDILRTLAAVDGPGNSPGRNVPAATALVRQGEGR